MNYDSTKAYGKLVRDLATMFMAQDDIYSKISGLYELNEIHYIYSRLAFRELYANYPANKEIVTFVIDEYVLNDVIRDAFLTKLFRNDQFEIECIKKELGSQYSFICHLQLLLQSMAITAHPENYIETALDTALNLVIKPVIERTTDNEANFAYAYASLYSKEVSHVMRVQEGLSKTAEPSHDMLYKIKSNEQALELYNFLLDTNVIGADVSLSAFLDAIVHADMSKIKPILVDKYRIAVARMKWLIKEDAVTWQKQACKSINVTASIASSNSAKTGKWRDNLYDILPSNHKK